MYETKLVAPAIKKGNLIIKDENHANISIFINTNKDILSKANLCIKKLRKEFPETDIYTVEDFPKNKNFAFICIDEVINTNQEEIKGFIDINGKFFDRRRSFIIAQKNGQIKNNIAESHAVWLTKRELSSDMINY